MGEPEEKDVDLEAVLKEINRNIKSIDKSLKELAGSVAGSVDPHDGVFCVRGTIITYEG